MKHKNTNERIINLILVDESGSMTSIYRQALEGMNRTIGTIKSNAHEVEGVRQYINLITFDDERYTQHLRHCPAEGASFISNEQYKPLGCTSLYDAIGRSVTALEKHVTENDAVLVTIITDGLENASHKYRAKDIKRLIERLSEKGWIFTYIGANQDVMLEGGRMGITNTMAFTANPEGAEEMWENERQSRQRYFNRVSDFKKRGKSMKEIMDGEHHSAINFFNR